MGTVAAIESNARPSLGEGTASAVLRGAARYWFVTAVIGQWFFLYYLLAFYGPSTLTGNFQAWSRNRLLFKGYVAGDTAGNLAFAAHALLAAVIAFGGALQLVPQIRARALAFHRWNGRVFMVTALGLSVSGLYMVWIRGSNPSMVGRLSISLNAVLIVAFAVLAWRSARRRDLAVHRRWALRLYLVANAQWFMRVIVMAWVLVNRAMGVKVAFGGPFIYFADFACFLLPLAVLELYLLARDKGGPRGRLAVAGLLIVMTLLMTVGMFGFSMFSLRILAKA
jgi:uncharacterized membrane protein